MRPPPLSDCPDTHTHTPGPSSPHHHPHHPRLFPWQQFRGFSLGCVYYDTPNISIQNKMLRFLCVFAVYIFYILDFLLQKVSWQHYGILTFHSRLYDINITFINLVFFFLIRWLMHVKNALICVYPMVSPKETHGLGIACVSLTKSIMAIQ